MDEKKKELAKLIKNYFGADAAYLGIDYYTLARRILEAGYEKPVRCKDCKWRNTKGCPYMNFNASARDDLDFCSDGERRSDNG